MCGRTASRRGGASSPGVRSAGTLGCPCPRLHSRYGPSSRHPRAAPRASSRHPADARRMQRAVAARAPRRRPDHAVGRRRGCRAQRHLGVPHHGILARAARPDGGDPRRRGGRRARRCRAHGPGEQVAQRRDRRRTRRRTGRRARRVGRRDPAGPADRLSLIAVGGGQRPAGRRLRHRHARHAPGDADARPVRRIPGRRGRHPWAARDKRRPARPRGTRLTDSATTGPRSSVGQSEYRQ